MREAGAYVWSRFHDQGEVKSKGRGNVVTEVDLGSERLIIERLTSEFPDFQIMAEESAAKTDDQSAAEYLWIIDPIDGTKNFSQGLPFFAVNLGLAHRGRMVLGLTYDPALDELFIAEAGKGAFLNGRPIHVADRPTVKESLLGYDIGYDNDRAQYLLDFVGQIWPGVQSLRNMGSAALGLAYVACGRLDIYIHHSLYPWDYAPGIVLIQEAGGVVTERDGSEASLTMQGVVAGNASVHDDLLRLAGDSAWRWAGLR